MSQDGKKRAAFPVQQHFVPEVLQKRFVGADGRLWVKRFGGDLWPSSPSRTFKTRHAYTYVDDDGGKSAFLEDKLSQLETAVDPLIEEIIQDTRASRFPSLSEEDWSTFITFFIMQYRRVPKFIDQVVKAGREEAVAEMTSAIANAADLTVVEQQELLSSYHVDRRIKNAMILSQTQIRPLIWNVMAARGTTIGKIENLECQFIIGSSPVARFRGHASTQLTDPTVELWLPLAPDVAFCSTGPSGEKKVQPLVLKKHVRHINRQITADSDAIASSSRDLVVALMRSRRLYHK